MNPKQLSILIGSLVAGILSTSYLGFINCLCCAGVILGGIAAVWHYTNTNALTITQGEGASMGAIAGAVGAVIAAILNFIAAQVGLDAQQQIQDMMLGFYEGRVPPEQYDEIARQMESQGGFSIVNTLIGIVVSAIFGAIGGVIGASVFKKGTDMPSDEF